MSPNGRPVPKHAAAERVMASTVASTSRSLKLHAQQTEEGSFGHGIDARGSAMRIESAFAMAPRLFRLPSSCAETDG
jgi:signal recognition particle subunit SEC65